ncbi:hypothetical protein O0L34_g19054 [Tuta absoluta]|nr:hypothetical protein O0L34_g19054 [Tuta absoluta]
MKTRGAKITVIPVESEDEDFSDEDDPVYPEIEGVCIEDSDPGYNEDEEIEEVELSDLDEPSTSTGRKNKGVKKSKAPNLKWIIKSIEYNEENTTFMGCEDLPPEIMALETPMTFFKYFFTTGMLALIEDQTLLYAQQTNPSKAEIISTDDIKKFIGIIIYMSVVQLPSTRHYWKQGTYIERVATTFD